MLRIHCCMALLVQPSLKQSAGDRSGSNMCCSTSAASRKRSWPGGAILLQHNGAQLLFAGIAKVAVRRRSKRGRHQRSSTISHLCTPYPRSPQKMLLLCRASLLSVCVNYVISTRSFCGGGQSPGASGRLGRPASEQPGVATSAGSVPIAASVERRRLVFCKSPDQPNYAAPPSLRVSVVQAPAESF